MCDELIIRRIAGLLILISVALGVWVSAWFLFFTAFVGANLLQSSFTGFCPLERILARAALFGCVRREGLEGPGGGRRESGVGVA